MTQREKVLLAQNWQPTRTPDSKTNWISPGLKVQFRFLRFAEEFNIIRENCNGDEVEALRAYIKIIEKSSRKASYFIKGGMTTLKSALSFVDKPIATGQKMDIDMEVSCSLLFDVYLCA